MPSPKAGSPTARRSRDDDEMTLVPAEEFLPEHVDASDYTSDEGEDGDGHASTKRTGTQQRRPTSVERRRRDHETLHAEEEAERLLHPARTGRLRGLFGSKGDSDEIVEEKDAAQWRESRRLRKGRGREDGEEETELMFKVEEGPGSVRSESSSSEDARVLQSIQKGGRRRKKSKFGRFAAIYVLIFAAFIALLYGAYLATRASRSDADAAAGMQRLWNGTHEFAPTTILISLDGFRADFLQRNITPAMSDFIRDGVSPKYMLPSFPSLTFPNHFTLATGRYPESHGIVGNTFWDPITQKEFYYTDPARSMTPEWWNAEPIWETAELQGVRTAIHMWPGSEAHIGTIEPAYVDTFKEDEALDVKIDRVVQWLDLPGPGDAGASSATPRPQLIAFYVPNVDSDGHAYGPNSTEIRGTIAEVDRMLDSLFKDVEARNLTNIVNIIIVSDHGMATTDTSRLIQYEDLIDPSLIEHTDGWPLYGLRPFDQSEGHLQELYQSLLSKSQQPEYANSFDVYLRDTNMPERYHFSHNPRIAPLWVVPKPGWAIVTREEFDVAAAQAEQQIFHPRGLHGYDHEHPLMRAIFLARGPAFPHPKNSRVPPFQNTELYNIVCDSLGLEPQPNNGTLRLPFQTVFADDNSAEAVEDPPNADDLAAQIIPPDLPGAEDLPEAGEATDDPPAGPDEPEGSNDNSAEDGDKHRSWLDWIKQTVDNVKGWVVGIVGGGDNTDDVAETQR